MVHLAKSFTLTFVKKQLLQDDVIIFYFSTPTSFIYRAGQYMQVTLLHDADDRGSSRLFTIASSPTEKYIMITTRRGRSSFKNALFTLQPGDTVQAFGPMGKFVLTDSGQARMTEGD